MTTREKVIEIINYMPESDLEAEYTHLRQTDGRPGASDNFEAALDALAGISRRVTVSADAAQLIRDERHWLASRVP